MKVFQSIQADCALLGIESNKKHEFNVKGAIIFSSYILGTVSCGYYFIYIDKPFEQYIKSYDATTSFLVCILQFINFFCQMPKLTDFFLKMGDFVQQRQDCIESKDIYNKAIRWAEQCYRIINFLLMKITLVTSNLPLYMTSIYTYYFTTASPDDTFVLPFFMWFPFNWKNPVGYTVASAIQCAMSAYELLITSCLASLGIVAFLIGLAVTKDLINILHVIQKSIKGKKYRRKGVKKLNQFIEIHAIVKENICSCMDVFQPVTVILLTWCIGTLCVALVLLEMGINGNNSVMLAVLILQVSMELAFFACELGQRITDAFDGVDEVFNELNWYLFPLKIKKILPTIMINTQEIIALKCFGSIVCGRETFKSVNNSAFSYFMVLREFT